MVKKTITLYENTVGLDGHRFTYEEDTTATQFTSLVAGRFNMPTNTSFQLYIVSEQRIGAPHMSSDFIRLLSSDDIEGGDKVLAKRSADDIQCLGHGLFHGEHTTHSLIPVIRDTLTNGAFRVQWWWAGELQRWATGNPHGHWDTAYSFSRWSGSTFVIRLDPPAGDILA
jgi:hypothetical protein